MTKILGIGRDSVFSPNSVSRDEAIFSLVVAKLQDLGACVDIAKEAEPEWQKDLFLYNIVFSMARGKKALQRLSLFEDSGGLVVNSAKSLLANGRVALHSLFLKNGIPVATSVDNPIVGNLPQGFAFPAWLKRGDACAQSREDVCFVENEEDLQRHLNDFSKRGIESSLLSQHIEGDLVKFYGVEGSSFFHLGYPTSGNNFSKFGLEEKNGTPRGYGFSSMQLKACADKCAKIASFPIYGGDCIISPDGQFHIIDFNDWPSFSSCRNEAAEAIANFIMAKTSKVVPMREPSSRVHLNANI